MITINGLGASNNDKVVKAVGGGMSGSAHVFFSFRLRFKKITTHGRQFLLLVVYRSLGRHITILDIMKAKEREDILFRSKTHIGTCNSK